MKKKIYRSILIGKRCSQLVQIGASHWQLSLFCRVTKFPTKSVNNGNGEGTSPGCTSSFGLPDHQSQFKLQASLRISMNNHPYIPADHSPHDKLIHIITLEHLIQTP